MVLREMIQRGRLASNELLPSEQELAKLFSVSRITAKRALTDLAKHGFVERQRGRGTLVRPFMQVPLVRGSFDSLAESIRQMGLNSDTELMEVTTMKASGEIAKKLELKPGTALERRVWRRTIEGMPFSLVESYVPQDVASRFSRSELAKESLPVLLTRGGSGPLTADQWISAVAGDPDTTKFLDVPAGSALLKVERLLRDDGGRLIQLILCHYRSDRFQWHIRSEGAQIGGVVRAHDGEHLRQPFRDGSAGAAARARRPASR
ncbi:MAG: GntR family transcriptional regulator [Steroidobacteraceae bacterium]|nr:GntR family transcriptional regulator [Steroidobacteraceae bacterium]